MNVNDVLELVNLYNSKKDDIFDHCADLFIIAVRNELEAIYNKGHWAAMVGYTQFGIIVNSINPTFQEFSIMIPHAWNLRFNESMEEYDAVTRYKDFIKDEKNLESYEILGFQGKEILLLKPFCEALERKGFKCYLDLDDSFFVVAFDVK